MKFLFFIFAFFLLISPLGAEPAVEGFPPQEKNSENKVLDFDTLLAQEDGQEFQFQGKTYVWQDGVPFEKAADGSLTQVASPEGEGELYVTEGGNQWLAQGADGSIYITVAPKIWAQINFEYNSADLKEEDKELLNIFGQPLSKPPLNKHRLILLGYTDGKGTEEYNLRLSRKRALAVGNYLSEHYGIDSKRIILQCYGSERPIADNETEEGRAQNRRVEFILLKPSDD